MHFGKARGIIWKIFVRKGEYPMQFIQYTCVHECYNAVYETLMQHEVQNLLPLGNLILGHQGKDNTAWRNPANWFMATVSDESGILLTAVMTPPMPLTLYATDNKLDANAINCLLDGIANLHLPGIVTEKALAECFAKAYTTRTGIAFEVKTNQRIYELTEINPEIPKIGTIRLLEERDMPFLPFWLEAMNTIFEYGQNTATMHIPTNFEYYQHQISTKKLYVLEVDGVPVSMAGLAREMETVIGVGRVYTPSYFRGKGYASSCVAQLSQLALVKGFKKCALYTDLSYPTSNSIYQKIGYKPICDSLHVNFIASDQI